MYARQHRRRIEPMAWTEAYISTSVDEDTLDSNFELIQLFSRSGLGCPFSAKQKSAKRRENDAKKL
jgi:hypothetical protein